jgi:hypothetical protein
VSAFGGLFALHTRHFDAGACILVQFITQTANGDVEGLCCMGSIAAAVSKRTNDMRSYCLGQSGVIVYDRHDLTFISLENVRGQRHSICTCSGLEWRRTEFASFSHSAAISRWIARESGSLAAVSKYKQCAA